VFNPVEAFARGWILGLSIAAVLGPIGVLCVRRTLSSGFTVGWLSGMGAATADAAYASLAAFGVTALTAVLVEQRQWLRLIGGLFLLYLGWRTLRARPPLSPALGGASAGGLAGAYGSTLLLTLSNPMTIMSFVAIFAGLGLGVVGGMFAGAALVLGVFLGSATWWLILACITSLFRTRLKPPLFRLVNIASGLIILGFGVQSLLSTLA
jgi:threonine/homoserine/homoserine lactone efflux protein